MSNLLVNVQTDIDTGTLVSQFETPGGKQGIAQRLASLIEAILCGCERGPTGLPASIALSILTNATRASGTFTYSSFATVNDVITISNVNFTAVATGATGNQFNVGSDATTQAANLAAAVNGSVTALIAGYVTASSALGVCTITSTNYGIYGNTLTMAKGLDAGTVVTVSGSKLTGGAVDPTAQTLSF